MLWLYCNEITVDVIWKQTETEQKELFIPLNQWKRDHYESYSDNAHTTVMYIINIKGFLNFTTACFLVERARIA